MRFLQPDMASWFLTLPVAFVFLFLHLRAKRRFRQRAAIAPHLRDLSRLSTRARDVAACAAAFVALGSLALALMRPQILVEMRTPEYERDDLVIVLDRSASMGATDIAPSRFARAVAEIRAFLTHKPEAIDRVGLVGFSGTSLILSHLTRDLGSLFFYLDWIEEDRQPQFGTNIAAALASARELARKDGRSTKKIFLVISDGDDQGRRLADEVAALRDEQRRVYCIGVGGEEEAFIPVLAVNGATELLTDDQGRPVTTTFDEMTLRGIANATGGRYFRSVSGTELAAALQDVVRRERRQVGWKTSVDYRDLHRESLVAAAAAALILLQIL